MNSRQARTLAALFAKPTPTSITWDEVVALLKSLGAAIDTGREGSRVGIKLHGSRHRLHRPHPGSELKQYQVRDLREFLTSVGVEPPA